MLIKVKELVLDERLYPRNTTDPVNVSRLSQRIRMGVQMEPIRIWADKNVVIDGWHRTAAYLQLFTGEHEIEVEAIEYKSEADAIEDAILINNKHGQYLTSTDLSIAWHRLSTANPLYDPADFQAMTGQTPRSFDRNVDKVVPVADGTVAVLKRGFMEPSGGRPLTKKEAKGIHSAGRSLGMSIRSLISILDGAGELIDVEKYGVLDLMWELYDKLGRFLEKYQEPSPTN